MVVLKEEDTKEVLEVDMGAVVGTDMEEAYANLPLVSIVERLVMYQDFAPNHTCYVHISTVSSMSPRIVSTC